MQVFEEAAKGRGKQNRGMEEVRIIQVAVGDEIDGLRGWKGGELEIE